MARYAYHQIDRNAAEIVAALKAGGCTVESIGKPVDIAVGLSGRTYLFEIKTAKGKLRETQVKFLDRWRGHVGILRSVEDVQLFLEVARRRR